MPRGIPNVTSEIEKISEASMQYVPETLPPRKRDKRKNFGHNSKLSAAEIDGYILRWVNDQPGRIAMFEEKDYSFVTHAEVGRTKREGDTDYVRELVGSQENGNSLYAYLMKIPEQYYLEDKEDYNQGLDKIDEAINGGDREKADGRYIPRKSYQRK